MLAGEEPVFLQLEKPQRGTGTTCLVDLTSSEVAKSCAKSKIGVVGIFSRVECRAASEMQHGGFGGTGTTG